MRNRQFHVTGGPILLGFLLLTSCLEHVEERSPFPDIKFDKTVYDFGEVLQGDRVEYSYRFRNVGIDTLKISNVRKGCGCQAAKSTRDVIPPGETGDINVVFNSRGYEGAVTKSVYVHSNDPEEPRVGLAMKGTVVVDLITRPRALQFGDLIVGETSSKKVYIVPQHLKTLEIKKIETSADYITVSTSDYTELEKHGYEIEVTLTPKTPIARIQESVTISTNSEQQPLIQVFIHGRVLEGMTVEPKTLHFRLRAGESERYDISMGKIAKKNFAIAKVDDDLEEIDTEVHFVGEVGDSRRYQVEVRAKSTASPGLCVGWLTLHTNDPAQPTVAIEISGVIE